MKVKITAVITKIVGYARATDLWNNGKVQEFSDRKIPKFKDTAK